MYIAIHTLGCKVNQVETAALETELRRRGHVLVPFDGPADAYIVNTCTVTAVSDKKSRQTIRQAQKRSPGAVVAVCGCYAQTDPKAVEALGVDLVAGTAGRMAFLDDLEALMSAQSPGQSTRAEAGRADRAEPPQTAQGFKANLPGADRSAPPGAVRDAPPSAVRDAPPSADRDALPDADRDGLSEVGRDDPGPPAPSSPVPKVTVDDVMTHRTFELLPAGGLEGRTRAMLKVEDGCTNFCSYCIIPYARGPVRSLPLRDAAEEAARLAAEGYRELVLTGIEISSWGRDLPGRPAPADLIEAVCAAAQACRVRLGSLEPRTVTEDFCRRLSALPNLCPHFHLSLQSGCDATLQRMNRKYDTARYFESVLLLRGFFDRPGLTTDLIAGFPGETEEEFAATLDFIRRCAFTAMHIFPYSRRAGTPAAKLPGQVPRGEKEARARRAAALAREMEEAWLASWVGETLPVLFEEEKDGLWRGHAPNYTEVYAEGEALHNRERPVTITGVRGTALLGEVR